MLRKVSVVILLSTCFSLATLAQDPAPEPDSEKQLARAFSFAFSGGSYLGVEIREVTNENYSELGLSEVRGVSVSKVLENSPADKAGIRTGDVIVGFNGESVTSTRKLTRLISEVAPDHTVNLTVVRGGSEISLPVTIGKRERPGLMSGTYVFPTLPDVPDVPFPPIAPKLDLPNLKVLPEGAGENFVWSLGARRTIGIGVSSLSKQLGDHFGVQDGKGILVTNVEEDSPASRAGLKAGDIITEANGKAVDGTGDLMRILSEEKEGDVTLTIVRDRNRRSVTVTPEERKGPEMFFERMKTSGAIRGVSPKALIRVAPRPDRPARPLVVQPGTRILR